MPDTTPAANSPSEADLWSALHTAMDGNLRQSRRRELLAAYRSAVLLEAASAVFALDFHETHPDAEFDSQRDAWDVGTIDAAELLRRMAEGASR